jgi:hypothetical protein
MGRDLPRPGAFSIRPAIFGPFTIVIPYLHVVQFN